MSDKIRFYLIYMLAGGAAFSVLAAIDTRSWFFGLLLFAIVSFMVGALAILNSDK